MTDATDIIARALGTVLPLPVLEEGFHYCPSLDYSGKERGWHAAKSVKGPHGRKPAAVKGGRGIEAARADVLDGTISMHQLATMRCCELAERYGIRWRAASYLRQWARAGVREAPGR
jgi:hypothetical protein